jgi:translation initiation factor IF-2
MVVSGKVRIYDLARSKVPEELDEKIKKKVQAELTRVILKYAQEMGQNAKTASSSIDNEAVDVIFKKISVEEIITNESAGEVKGSGEKTISKKTETTKAKASSTAAVIPAEAPKKQLKIVRRITITQQEEEKVEEDRALQEAANPTPAVEEKAPETETVVSAEAENTDEDSSTTDENLQDLIGNKKTVYTRDSVAFKDMSNVRSIPLRPVSSYVPPQQQTTQNPSTGQANTTGVPSQPYRVAKPTISVQGMGRKRKRGQATDDRPKQIRRPKTEVVDAGPKNITITKPMTVRELSHTINLPETQIITYFFMRKIIKTVNDTLEKDLIIEYLKTLNYNVLTKLEEEVHTELKNTLAEDESEGNLITRPPVVTIMGHVDHGKTTLVDTIRKTKAKIVDKESGGITQHISTYRIQAEDFDGNTRKITLLDTPGHEAFTAMRKRGANVTDIVVLIVSADDGVMPQTLECIKHIKENHIPFVVAINKIDKPGANPDKVLAQLAEYDIITQDYGGKVECAKISALNNLNIDDLLMKVILVADAELADKIQSNPNRLAVGTVIEAQLSRTKGPIATVLIQNGTLHKGDFIAAGAVSGRVKAMVDETGALVDSAEPSTAVQVLGLTGVPKAGDSFRAYKSIQEAKEAAGEIAEVEISQKRFRGISSFASEIKEGQDKELRIIIKADVQGSAEAISHELNKLSTGEVLVKPISIDSGSITSNDVLMAEQTGAVIVGFHVGADTAQTAKLAERLKVRIKSYEIIYKLTEDLERAVLGLHEPEIEEVKVGKIEVRKIFAIDNRKIAGSYVTEGKIVRNEIARVFRDGAKIYEGKVDYLRRFKDDAKEVKEGFECGLSFEKYNDLQEGDTIECWTVKEIARTKL